jgi:LytB protein/Phosphorylase superfamily
LGAQPLLVFAPLRLEAAALGRPGGLRVIRSGMGAARARIAAARALAIEDVRGLAVAGVCAGVAPELAAGDVVLATELRRTGRDPVPVHGSALLEAALRRRGLRVHLGPVASVEGLSRPAERRRLREDGVIAADMESAWLADGAAGRPLAIVRVVVESSERELYDPRTVPAGARALLALRRTAPALGEWAAALGPKRICYATTNRQQAVREIARDSDVVLVVGSPTSSNSLRLVEVAEREGTPAHLVDDEHELDVAWLAGAKTVGLSAGASAPETLVDRLVTALDALGGAEVEERPTTTESLRFRLPSSVAAR